MNNKTLKQAASYGEPDNKMALERLADVLEMPADHIREAAQAIRRERKEKALLEKVRLIREGNTAILQNGEIVPRGTPGSMNYDTASCNASYGEPWHCESDWMHIRREDTQEIVAAVVLRPTQKNKIPDSPTARRIVQCVNACAGIADPEKALKAARDALTKLLDTELYADGEGLVSIRSALAYDNKELSDAVHAALAQLNNTK